MAIKNILDKLYLAIFVMLPYFVNQSRVVASGINCTEGLLNTHKVKVNYQPVMYGCMEDKDESKQWPGPPTNLIANVSVPDSSFQLSWKPPDDSSADYVTGFIVEMFLEETGDTVSFQPTCYLVETKLDIINGSRNIAPQDAVFHLDCKMKSLINVRVRVIPLPPPLGRNYKDTRMYVTFRATTTRPILLRPSTAILNPVEPPEDDMKSESVIAILMSVVFVCVCILTAACFIVCRTRRHHSMRLNGDNREKCLQMQRGHAFNSTQTQNNKITARDILYDMDTENCESFSASVQFTSNTPRYQTEHYHLTENKGGDISNGTPNEYTLSENIRTKSSIPKKYRHQLQLMNLER